MKKSKNQAIRVLISFVFFIIPFGSLAQNVPISKKLKTEPKYTIDLYSAFKNAKACPLSFIAEEIDYIPLEKSKDCLIGDHLTNIFLDNENIIVFDYENCYRFNRSGKFVNKIGKKGHGPGEYIRPTRIAVDTNVKAVYFLDKDRVLKYSYKGEFLQEFGLDFKAMTILQYKTGIFLLDDMFYQYANPDKRFSIRFFSEKEEKQIAKVDCPKKDKIPFSISFPITYNFNQKTFLKDYWDNNIYTVEDPLSLRHYALINTGKLIHRAKDDESVITGKKNKGDELVLDITYISETDRFVFLLGNKGLFTFDKASRETTCCEFKKVGEKWQNFENDLTGGPTLLPNNFPRLPVNNNTFVTFNHAYEFFEEGIDSNNKQIKELMKNLQPDDNPVLVLVKLKE